jgi:hypothetical protein
MLNIGSQPFQVREFAEALGVYSGNSETRNSVFSDVFCMTKQCQTGSKRQTLAKTRPHG